MWFSPSEKKKYNLRNGDLVVLEGGDVGRCAILGDVPEDLGFQNSIHRVRVRRGNDIRFVYYWMAHLKSFGYFDLVCSKATLAHFTGEKFAETPYPVVDFATQRQIADFLDRETARIDLLIEKKQRLVALLGEKWSAAITDAVTGRANRRSAAGDGEVMCDTSQHDTHASWDRRKIKFHLSGFFGGGTPSKDNLDYWTDGTVPWVTPKDMKRRMIDAAEDLITVDAVKKSATNMVPPSAVLMVVRSGILKHSLPVGLNTVPVALNQDMKAFRFRRSLLPEFFTYWIEGQQKQKLLEWCQIGATVDNIDVDAMLNGQIAVPDLAAQRQIIAFLDRETARISAVQERTKASIDRLKEYRSALITAAVTGQIDVQTHTKSGTPDRRLDAIQEEMGA